MLENFVSKFPQPLEAEEAGQIPFSGLDQKSRFGAGLRAHPSAEEIIGLGLGARRRRAFVGSFAEHHGPILLTGERGTGKETIARALHYRSQRGSLPFICLDSSRLISGEHLRNLLFGSSEPAARGRAIIRRGVAELIGAGTVYVGELSQFSADEQQQLLEVAGSQRFRRGGESQWRRTELRLIMGSEYSVAELEKNHLVLPEWLETVASSTLPIEPLRERKEDIPLFVERFSYDVAGKNHRDSIGFTAEALGALNSHSWPGNVSELKSTVEEAILRQRPEPVDLAHLSGLWNAVRPALPDAKSDQHEFDFYQESERFHRALIESTLRRTAGSQRKASALLNLKETTLSAMIRRLGIDRNQTAR